MEQHALEDWGEKEKRVNKQQRILEDFWREDTKEAEMEQLQSRLSRYAFRYYWNFYLCSIFPRVRLRIFNVLLIGVDEKGHNLFCWDSLPACLPCFDFGFIDVFESIWLHAWMWSCSFFFCLNPILLYSHYYQPMD